MLPATSSTDVTYFGYGSNMNPHAMRAVCPAARALGVAHVHGFRLVFRRVISAEPAEPAELTGVLWMISLAELARLDAHEDYPRLYDRVLVEARDERGNRHEPWMYVMRPRQVPIAPPEANYLELVMAGARHWNLPTSEIAEAAREAQRVGEDAHVPTLPWDDARWRMERDD